MRQAKTLFLAAAVVALFLNGCQAMQTVRTKRNESKVVGGFASPESVIADPSGKRFFVSNVGVKLEPGAKDADGFISELTPDGEVVNLRFLPKEGALNAPKGMAIIAQTLYVTDIDRVVGFDINTREKTFELDFSAEKTAFLNDLAVMDDKTLAVSATDTGKVYIISLAGKQGYIPIADNIAGPNGLYFDKTSQLLIVVGFGNGNKIKGELGVIEFTEGGPKYQKLTGPIGALDGVSLLPDGRVIFSDWVAFDRPGLIRIYDPATKELSTLHLSEEVRGPADFYYDAGTKTLWLPRMLEGKILIEKIK